MKKEEKKYPSLFVGFLGKISPKSVIEEHRLEFVVAKDINIAKKKVIKKWKSNNVHLDGIKELKKIDGYKIILKK